MQRPQRPRSSLPKQVVSFCADPQDVLEFERIRATLQPIPPSPSQLLALALWEFNQRYAQATPPRCKPLTGPQPVPRALRSKVLEQFVNERCVVAPDFCVGTQMLFDAYVQWRIAHHKAKKIRIATFSAHLRRVVPSVMRRRSDNGAPYFEGIGLKNT